MEQLSTEARQRFTAISNEVLKSAHFQLWTLVQQGCAVGDPTAVYLNKLGTKALRRVLPIIDYFSPKPSENDEAGGSGRDNGMRVGKDAPSREYANR
jgi:hypothetical protein